MNLLISAEAQWLGFGIAFFLLALGVSLIAYAIRTAECYEHGDDPIPGDLDRVSYDDIMNSERPYNPYELYN